MCAHNRKLESQEGCECVLRYRKWNHRRDLSVCSQQEAGITEGIGMCSQQEMESQGDVCLQQEVESQEGLGVCSQQEAGIRRVWVCAHI